MERPVVLVAPGASAEGARALARRLGLDAPDVPPRTGLALLYGDSTLEILALEPRAPGPVGPEFVAGAFGRRRLRGLSRHEPLARAAGVRRHGPVRVLDATPGLGRDAWLLASLGCQVEACERHPVVAAMLQAALARANAHAVHDSTLATIAGRIDLRGADARTRLSADAGPPRPAVVLLDPMFPERRGSALVRKDMRLLRRLVGDDQDAPEVLALALERGCRVVVRRPAGAACLPCSRPPDLVMTGRRTRLDVYLA